MQLSACYYDGRGNGPFGMRYFISRVTVTNGAGIAFDTEDFDLSVLFLFQLDGDLAAHGAADTG